jgi:hypothetical protein
MTRTNPQLPGSLPTDDNRNFSSSPVWRSLHSRLESYAELCAFARRQDFNAKDGHAARAAERIRMQRELQRIATLCHRASFPRVQS